jgi:hypothetical protein
LRAKIFGENFSWKIFTQILQLKEICINKRKVEQRIQAFSFEASNFIESYFKKETGILIS